MNLSGYLFLRTASCSVVFQPFMKKSFRYVGWEDGDVDIAFFEQVFHHLLLGVALILLERPHVVSRAEVLVVVVETLDPSPRHGGSSGWLDCRPRSARGCRRHNRGLTPSLAISQRRA